jgi:shikimate dehydrogenase
MAVNYKAELVGVLGYPVAENPTCVMQEAAFAALGLNWRYLTMEVKPENLADALRGVRALGMRGINLTIPHQVAVMPLLDDIAPDAKVIGAVNTVYRDGDRLIGANTDGKGFLRGLRDERRSIRREAVVLGAGGAARAITFELAFAGASGVGVINRERRTRPAVSGSAARDTSRRSSCRGRALRAARPISWSTPRRSACIPTWKRCPIFRSTRRDRICSCVT